MDNLKKGWYVCKGNFIRWRTNYRIWMIAAIEAILIFQYLHGLSKYGLATGKTITPFVLPIVFAEAENSNGLLKVLIYLGCVMLFCNAPFLNNQKLYTILRCKRKGWYLGENMYLWLTAFLYMAFVSVASLAAVLPTVSTNRLWGEIAGDFVVNQGLTSSYARGLVMPVRVIQNYYPLAAFAYTFTAGWLSMVFIGKLIYLLNLRNGKKTIGISAAVFLIMLDPVTVYFTMYKKYGLFYVSPINWSSLENINTVSGYSHLSGSYMFAMYIVLIVAESLLSYICSIEMDIEVKTIESC